MDIVVDTSALLAVILDEPERDDLIAATRDSTLLAPGSVPWEVGNALVAAYRRKRITGLALRDAWSAFERIPVRWVDVDVAQALALAQQHGVYAYDAYVIEAARIRRIPLLTLDGRERRVATELGLELVSVTP